MKVNNGEFKVVSVGGDPQLGGRDIDTILMEYVHAIVLKKYKKDVFSNKRWTQKLNKEVVEAKKRLSLNSSHEILLEEIITDLQEEVGLTRAQFETMIAPILAKIESIVRDTISATSPKMKPNDIHEILLIGGSSKIPAVQKLLEKIFPGKKLNKSIDPEQAVAFGATVRAAQLSSSKKEVPSMTLFEATPISVGFELYDGTFEKLIKRNTQLPTKKFAFTYETTLSDQREMMFNFFEGERPIARKNNYLGSFTLQGISPGIAGSQQVTLTVQMDKNGILSAQAQHEDKIEKLKINYFIERDSDKNTAELIQGLPPT